MYSHILLEFYIKIRVILLGKTNGSLLSSYYQIIIKKHDEGHRGKNNIKERTKIKRKSEN